MQQPLRQISDLEYPDSIQPAKSLFDGLSTGLQPLSEKEVEHPDSIQTVDSLFDGLNWGFQPLSEKEFYKAMASINIDMSFPEMVFMDMEVYMDTEV